ncbi:uncharacterized protein LOC124822505 [Vigna umbellata]|uniref:Uncharacterized protein n=2 Tax=Phaseolus angularis TaxID=3914 RepID=A0A8T0KT21_PHAAN|nr:uncharacterized protein LOC108319822 [Vigna angularis]XP_047150470.1 uncharacterized protein LOC124822505 [Vigna umbellata]KAG2403117.1 uncharacterized protein HKW66_Vig0184030 [Vigna angularis]BAT96050.1 hypothetical protein VIGAN_08292000 [Vigna angularis var. angularis]
METHLHQCYWYSSKFLGHPIPPSQLSSSWRPFLLARPFCPSLVSCSSNNFPRWDSNAESFRPRNFTSNGPRGKEREEQEQGYGRKRRWWSDEEREFPEDEEDISSGIVEEAIDGVWFLQIFKSYGWTLPVILASWLLSSGPKAFLMALALPLGQSALALAFDKLWRQSESKPKRKNRTRRKPRRAKGTIFEEEPAENQRTKNGYQSWVVEDNGSVDKGSQEAAQSFGGWDHLERSRPVKKSSFAMDGSPTIPSDGGRLSRRERKSDTPLLFRLLIAIFPFLGIWTKML